jgi:MarC family membrane protein
MKARSAMPQSFLSATLLLFLVLDSFGNTPIVAALLRDVEPGRRPRVIVRECAVAYAILMAFLLFGGQLMRLFSLSETSLGIGGGVVLFLIALRMIFPPAEGGVFGDTGGQEPLIVPIAVPAIAGPSAMAMVMLFASREPERLLEWAAAVTLAMLLTTGFLLAGSRLVRVLGTRGMTAFERLMGLILAALAVEMLLRGVQSFVAVVRATG